MKNFYLLIKPRFLAFRNQLISSTGGKRRRIFFLGGAGAAFCCGMFIVSTRVLIHFQSVEVIGDLVARYLLSMILLTFFSLLIFSHIITAVSNLYLSKDLEFCHSTPVSVEALFFSRSFYTLMDSSWMLLIFGLPVFMAYAYVYRPGAGFYFTLFHLNLAMVIIAAGMGILITMLLVYVFPAQRTKDIIMFIAILMVVALYFLFRFLRPERLANPESFFSIMEYLSALKAPQSPYLPTQWITETLWDNLTVPGGKRHIFSVTLTWITAVSMVVINVWVAQAVYIDGFSKSQEAKKRRKVGKKVLDVFVRCLKKPFDEDLGAIIAKDFRTFFRDNTQWSQLILLGALVVVYVYNFSVLPLDKSPIQLDFLQNELAFLNMGLAGFVLSAISARFIFTAVSAEGEAYWVIRSSPLRLRKYLWGKYVYLLFPMIFLGELLVIFTNYLLDVTRFMMLLSSITMLFMVLGIVALGIGFGALYANFKYENIAQLSVGFGGVLYMIVSSIFIAIVILLEAGPVYILFVSDASEKTVTHFQWLLIMVSFVMVMLINTLAIFKPMRMGLKALREYEG
jgi:ABC-2 type transport system permease protein